MLGPSKVVKSRNPEGLNCDPWRELMSIQLKSLT